MVVQLKFWPQKLWKKIVLLLVLIIIVAFVAFAAFAGLLMSGLLSREVVSEISVLNDGGSKTALVVYQPGFSSFPKDASYAFAEGLALSDWRVEITTASPKAPVDLSKYTLLTLAYPVYGGTAGTAIVNYINRIGDLGGINTLILACGGGDTGETLQLPLSPLVLSANGTIYNELSLSNQDSSALDVARQTGIDIQP